MKTEHKFGKVTCWTSIVIGLLMFVVTEVSEMLYKYQTFIDLVGTSEFLFILTIWLHDIYVYFMRTSCESSFMLTMWLYGNIYLL